MSLLKHLVISIAITIFIAWRFPETNLQIAIQNGSNLFNIWFDYFYTTIIMDICIFN